MTPAFEDGHFYSPVVNVAEVQTDATRIWRERPEAKGITLDMDSQRDLLTKVFPPLLVDFSYPDTGPLDTELDCFYESNGQFENLDPRALFCFMKIIRPRRIIEVGSGYSTLLMSDVNERFLDRAAAITCIEPYPRPFLLRERDAGRISLLQSRLQDIDGSVFDELQSGDILFIDSSHVSKTGSDVNRLFLDILPSIRPGVYIHVHDIFIPEDYPKDWVIAEGRSWNEQYLLQAFLSFNPEFRVIFAAWHASMLFKGDVEALMPGRRPVGGSFWMQRIAKP